MIRSSVRALHGVRRSPQQQAWLVVLGVAAGLFAAYQYVASIPHADDALRQVSENRLLVIAAGAAAALAIWTVVNQWAISRRQLTIEVLRQLETDKEYADAQRRFNRMARREHSLKGYAKGLPDHLKSPPDVPKKGSKKDLKRAQKKRAQFDRELAEWRDDEAAIHLVLNQDELLAIGIRNSILDYRLICAYWRTALIRRYVSASDFINELRHQSRTPTMYIEMQRFAEQLQRDYYHGLL